MSPLLLRAGLRYHRRHPWQAALAGLGIALGVAVVVSVDVATHAARRAFALSAEAVTGRATHEIIGGPAGLPDSLYAVLRVKHGIDSIAPVVDRHVRLPAHGGATLRLLGLDPFAEAPFRPYTAAASGLPDVSALLTRRAVLLARPTAGRLGVRAGDTIAIGNGAASVPAVVAGVLDAADELSGSALSDIALTDIATAQELTNGIGVVDRIEVRASADSAGARMLARIRAALPPGARLIETEARTGATLRLTRAFDTNLTALALVALVFGMFLIYNSVTFSLVQRRQLIGLLRAQGVTAREVLTLVLVEAAVLGAVATLAGILLGQLLGTQLVRLVARTINDLYFAVAVTTTRLDPLLAVKAALLGVTATVGAALPPALEAVRARPRAALARASLERGARTAAGRLAILGLAAAAATAVLLLAPSRSITLGFSALFVLILAAALLTPATTILLMRLVRPLLSGCGPVPRMAARGVTASLSRTAPAIAALSVAVAVGIAVTIMIGSFRAGVIAWLNQTLQADLYISAPGLGANRNDAALDPALAAQIAALPGVAGVTTYRHAALLVGEDFLRVIALDLAPGHRDAFTLLDATPAAAWTAFENGAVLVSEPIAFREGIGAGDSITLPTDRGSRRFAIAASFRDYASEHGVIMIQREAYERAWDDAATTSLAVFIRGDAQHDDITARIRELPAAAGVTARPNAGLRAATLQVFDRTFIITGVLRLLALIVAFVGVTGALMALQLERAHEIRVLRTIGLTPAQVWALVTAQTALMGLAAVALAVPLGLVMSWAMVNVINRRSFGWSFDMLVGTAPLLQALAIGIGAALLAGLYPAWKMSR
ncbi:MAG: FtsX-like permease family protein [Gemmatimonadota bacterium]